jgi:mitochondrial translocator assembly and maintenance protein 41
VYYDIKEDIINFLNKRPEVLTAFGYGSGVNSQKGYSENDKPQIDLILGVNDVKKWHMENIKYNPKDYSLSGKIYLGLLPKTLQNIGADITYLPYLRDAEINKEFKIGIIERKDLIDDLKNWKNFFLAGRFHKPVLAIKTDDELDNVIIENRKNALIIASILLKNNDFSKYDLYKKICSLSYIGDPRMGIAENPRKIDNIVEANIEYFDKHYSNININSYNNFKIECLPSNLSNYLIKFKIDNNDEILLQRKIISFLEDKNRTASSLQALKGILTAGLIKSFNYGMQKRMKYIKNNKKTDR